MQVHLTTNNITMKIHKIFIFLLSITLWILSKEIKAQNNENNLDSLLNSIDKPSKEYIKGTFKATRVINLQSTEKTAPGSLQFLIQHRFGPVNGGAYQFFGLDQAGLRLGLEYGVSRLFSLGIGRSTYNKNYDGYIKASILRQSKGSGSLPFSILYFGSVAVNSLHITDPEWPNYFSTRLSYTNQIIIASKVNKNFSLELVPTFIHKNLAVTVNDPNDFLALGVGLRYKLSKRVSINAEYVYRIPPKNKSVISYANFYNSLSFGFDIETGGHVFQLILTNSLGMYETAYITETTQQWSKAGIQLGFNISRDFTFKKK